MRTIATRIALLLALCGVAVGQNKINAATQLTNAVPVANGGVGQAFTYSKGDILCAVSSSVLARLAVGSNTQILTADSTQTCGVKWAAAPATSYTATLPIVVTGTVISINNFGGDSGSGGTKGAVPAPAAGDTAAGKYLKADGSWSVPPGTGGVPDTGTTANIAIVSDGSHGIAVGSGSLSTGGSGTTVYTVTSTTVGGLSGLSSLTAGKSVVEITDASACGDTATGGGSTTELVRYNGSGWDVITCSPSGVNGAIVLISEQVLSSTATTFTFSSIPSTYRDLIVRCEGRGDAASTALTPVIRFNGDTGADYNDAGWFQNTSWVNAQGTSQTSGLGGISGIFPGSSSPSSYSTGLELTIQNYKGTTFFKRVQWQGAIATGASTSGLYSAGGSFWWTNTAAITQITVGIQTGNFIAGSRCSLYGSF